MKIDCRKCENLDTTTYACKVYGPECGKATMGCVADQFKNYKPKSTQLQEFTPGEPVYVVERDEDGNACETSGYMFLAKSADAVILSPYINDLDTLEETLEYHIEQTAEDYDTHLAVFPAADCYENLDLATKALNAEKEDRG